MLSKTAFSAKLYYALIMTCRGQALNRVTNAGDSEGLEAWRQLVKHHEPNTKTRVAGMLLSVMSHDFSGDMSERFETFDRDIRKYEHISGEEISENVKVGIIMRQLPAGSLKEHLLLQADRFKTAQEIHDAVIAIQLARKSSQNTPQPMSIDEVDY